MKDNSLLIGILALYAFGVACGFGAAFLVFTFAY